MGSSWYINGEGETADVETAVRVVVGFNVDRINVAGFEVVGVVLGLDGEAGEEPLLLGIPAEDALQIARRIIHVASGTRPLNVQEKINGLKAEKETDTK